MNCDVIRVIPFSLLTDGLAIRSRESETILILNSKGPTSYGLLLERYLDIYLAYLLYQ